MSFMKHYKKFYAGSLAVMAVGLIMFVIFGFNLGIDFSGGTMLQIRFDQTIETKDVQDSIKDFNLSADVIYAGSKNDEIIIKTTKALDNEWRTEVFNAIKAKFNLNNDALLTSEQFGPNIGNEIKQRAFIAIALSALGMLAYVTVRFEMRFGIAAIVALLHDVAILLSIYAIFRVPVNSAFIAAVLTVVGYSINDTIVVFDRIRDNLKYAKTANYERIADESITTTLTRTINTSGTTLVVVLALLIFGAPSIKELAMPLLAGIAAGTYSSICIASPIWVSLKKAQRAALR